MSKKILVVCDKDKPSVSLQQIPQSLKRLFKAKEGHTFIGLDYGQQEYRTLANLSGDENMKKMFASGQDFYKAAASTIFNVPVSQITPAQRSAVKTVFIAIMYGMSPKSISSRLGISEQESNNLLRKWHSTFQQASAFRERVKDYGLRTGKATTFFGRVRDYGDPAKRPFDVANLNECFSTTIQGTSADLSKTAMIMLDKKLKEKKWGAIKIQLHDEFIIEVKDEFLEEAKKELPKVMQESVHIKEDWIPYTTSMHVGKNWAEASKE